MQAHAFRHNGTAEGHGGREWAAIKMGQSRRAPQYNNSVQNINIQQRQEQQEPHGLQTLRRAEKQHRERLVTGSICR